MSDKERIRRIASILAKNGGGIDVVRKMKCGGKLYGDGGDVPYNGEIRQGKKWSAVDHYLADNPKVAHGIRKAGVLLDDAARIFTRHNLRGLEGSDGMKIQPRLMTDFKDISEQVRGEDNPDSAVDRMSRAGTIGGAVARIGKPILDSLDEGVLPWVEGVRGFANKLRIADRLINMGQFIDDFATPANNFDGGGKFFRTSIHGESTLISDYPSVPYIPAVSAPVDSLGGIRPLDLPADTSAYVPTMVQNYAPVDVPVYGIEDVSAPAPVDLFSDEAKAYRRLKQRYAESRFDNNAQSPAGAKGPWQIMDATYGDYLKIGKGKPGNIYDPEYNGKVRDWVFSRLPKSLGEFWDENDSDINKLAKLYAAYNWGAGNLKNFLRSRRKAGLGIDDPYEWVEAIQNKGKWKDETKNYVKFLALDQDIPGKYLTREKFEKAAAKRGYTFKRGGKKKNGRFSNAVLKAAMADNPAVMTASGWRVDKNGDVVQDSQDEPGVKRLRNSLEQIAYIPFGDMAAATAGAAITGTKAYRGWKLARELNRITKAGVVDDAVDAAKNTLMYEPGRIPSGTYYGFVDTVDDISRIPEPVGAGYSGYTPTSQSKEGARFVADVDEAVKMAEARGGSHVKLDEFDPSLEKRLGKKIGGGVDHTVYQHPDDPDRVIKIAKLGEDTREYAIEAALDQLARTDKLYEMPLSLEGVMRYPEVDQWVPVYSQQKLTTLPKAPGEAVADMVDDFARRIGTEPYYGASDARINNVFLENVGPMGYSPSEGWYEIRPGEYKDFHPDNIGFTKDGFLMGFDLRRNGGRIHIKPENRGRLFEDGGLKEKKDKTRIAHVPVPKIDSLFTRVIGPGKMAMTYLDPEFVGPLSPYQQLVADTEIKKNKYLDGNGTAEDYMAFVNSAQKLGEATLSKHPELLQSSMFWPYQFKIGLSESPNANEAIEYFKSYANSPGFDRIRRNQEEWDKNADLNETDELRESLRNSEFYDSYEMAVPTFESVHFNNNGFDGNNVRPGASFVGNVDVDGSHPYYFVLGHELMHQFNPRGFGTQTRALGENKNTEKNNHDELDSEKHSDVEGLKFLLFKEGIYDSRGERDCTPTDMEMLRRKYPNLRPLLQMDNEQAAWMVNHVADAGEQETLYGNHLGNLSASGGKIRIKPENRGKFNALKKRTGHSASWFKAHGTPAQKKMAVFALNSRKWKHGDGGLIDRMSATYGNDSAKMLDLVRRVKAMKK